MQTILVYVYVLDDIATVIGEVRISGSRPSPCENKSFLQTKQGGSKESSRFHPVHVVNNFKFQITGFRYVITWVLG
jgi:hypothetical protein